MAAMAWCLLVQPGYAATSITNPGQFLDQAESLRLKDHAQFAQMLAQIHPEAPRLSEAEQWHLRYLDAWEDMFNGNYIKSETEFHQIIDRSGDPVLIAKASGLLLSNLAFNRRYEEAFALANHLASSLPEVKNPESRYTLLTNLSQMLDFGEQTDLAVQYARMAEDAVPPGESLCRPFYLEAAALYNGKRLTSASSELRRAIDVCTAAKEPVFANGMWLVLASLHIDENQPAKALALLDQVAASVRTAHYYPHRLSSRVERAQAYLKLGNDGEAKKAALDALAISQPDDTSEWLMDDYQVLYQIEKQQGHNAAALNYYEHYSNQEKSHLDDIRSRALAYDMAEQHLLMQKMETERLSKQNSILTLQQTLTAKAIETGRLYIVLLVLVLVSVILWLFRLKRSQLRFKQLSCLDGLTGISHYQHFTSEAGRALQLLEKKHGIACLIAIDLDHFKQINDTHGHALGDAVLKCTVAVCQQHLRSEDLFGRLGGEEFCVLLLDCHREQGMAIADRIRATIEATLVDVEGGVMSFSASLGVACTDRSGYELQRLCKDADAALYRAKRHGRNRVIADTGSDDLQDATA
ncbi:sensor domain-containing diguanylate cyclase [Dyella nitratireducens]|uniref:diguanylate cyclase n=2 Tax=Dyella nitratireducens TaxID=1849580 RepID=A0ABQ1FUA1_9GAMM|nr:GGDEF domain-containing protein [Dyella nitratireducens]GGA29908.1 GGDEF domain-containing protein [Dyella nitratireducens]